MWERPQVWSSATQTDQIIAITLPVWHSHLECVNTLALGVHVVHQMHGAEFDGSETLRQLRLQANRIVVATTL